jgi:hypothetical protein
MVRVAELGEDKESKRMAAQAQLDSQKYKTELAVINEGPAKHQKKFKDGSSIPSEAEIKMGGKIDFYGPIEN